MSSSNRGANNARSSSRRPRTGPSKVTASNNPAVRLLMQEFQNLQKDVNEGFRVSLPNENNIFEWEVALFGPPETVYAGGYFKATMKFPQEYPFAPPSVKFNRKLYHPNIYDNGNVCISILHSPSNDVRSGELPSERWNPAQNARSVILSILSLLGEPNTNSPANVDASLMYRRWKEQADPEYERVIREQIEASKAEAERDGVAVPTTVKDYCQKRSSSEPPTGSQSYEYPSMDLNDDECEN